MSIEDKVSDHPAFSRARNERFGDSDIFRRVFECLLSESRKFATDFVLANPYTAQKLPQVRAAVLGNAGSLIVFRVGAAEAELLAPKFHPPVT